MRLLLIYLLFLLSGASGLIYEVIWMRAMRLVLGSSVEAASIVLATFLGGLALGSFLGAKLSRSGAPLKRYAMAEFVIGATALLVPLWLMAYQAIYPTLYAWFGGNPLALSGCRLSMAFLAMGPPTIAMGTTLPFVTRAMVRQMDRFAWHTGILYAVNTFGAMCGALAAGFYLPMLLGINGSIYLAAAINVLVGVVAWKISEESAGTPLSPTAGVTSGPDRSPTPGKRLAPTLLLLAALSGFGSLALEMIYFRILSFRSEGSVYSFSLLLVFVLAFLALAAVWVARNLDHHNAWRFLAWTQLAAVVVLLLTPLTFLSLRYIAGYEADDTFAERMTRYTIASAVILGPSMLLIGVVLPCTWKLAASDTQQSGRTVGLLTGVNTLAAVAGSLTAGYYLLPVLGLGLAALLVAILYGCIAAIAFRRAYGGKLRWLGGVASLALVAVWFVLGGWRLQLLAMESGLQVISYHDGADATVAVLQRSDGHRILKINHDYTLGSSAAADREVRQGRLPLVLHPEPSRVASVGVATGMTVCSALDFPVDRVAAIELLPGVARVLPLFAKWNRDVADDPRVEIVVEDGRNFLMGTSESFDVIIGDLFVPWHAGTGDLYSVEHFSSVRQRLAPGGIFGQCLPGYQLTLEDLRSITASLLKVFPNTFLWRNDFNVDHPILCLTAYRDEPFFSAEAVVRHADRLKETEGTPAKFLAHPSGLPLLYICGPDQLAEWVRGAPLNTDDHPLIEFGAPKSHIQHQKRNVQPIQDFLASMRPRQWPFGEQPSDRPVEVLFQVADLVNDAQIAFSQNNFEREFRKVRQLARLAGDLPAVVGYVMVVANRYRSRQMSERSIELLKTLIEFPDPPVQALVALAQEYRSAGNDEGAIELLEKTVERSPQLLGPRKTLVDILEVAAEYTRAEPHLRELIKSRPKDPYLRLDLAKLLHRQEKTKEVYTAMDEFREAWDGSDSKAVWRYLRTKGLGPYVDTNPAHQDQPPALPTLDPSATLQE